MTSIIFLFGLIITCIGILMFSVARYSAINYLFSKTNNKTEITKIKKLAKKGAVVFLIGATIILILYIATL